MVSLSDCEDSWSRCLFVSSKALSLPQNSTVRGAESLASTLEHFVSYLRYISEFLQIEEILELFLVCKQWFVALSGESRDISKVGTSVFMYLQIRLPPTQLIVSSSKDWVAYYLKSLTSFSLTHFGRDILHLNFEFCPYFSNLHVPLLPESLLSLNLNGCPSINNTTLQLIAKRCTQLRHLHLYWNRSITDSGLVAILMPQKNTDPDIHRLSTATSVVKLLSLNISGCVNISDKSIDALIQQQLVGLDPQMPLPLTIDTPSTHPNIQTSHISNNYINWVDPALFNWITPDSCAAATYTLKPDALTGLLELNLTKCFKISESRIQLLCKSLTHLRKLILYGCNHLESRAFSCLHYLKQLQILDLCGTLITDEEEWYLSSQRKLLFRFTQFAANVTNLQACNCIPTFTACKNLCYVDMSWCLHLTDLSVFSIARNCHHLQWISLHGIQAISLSSFNKLLNSPSAKTIRSIDIQGCKALRMYLESNAKRLKCFLPHLQCLQLHS